jgi:hypothetical protein
MAVVNGQIANQTTFNNAFMSRTAATTQTVAKVALENADSGDSGAIIANAQKAINKVFEGVGSTGESDTTINDYSSNEYITDGDNRKVAIGKLDAQLKLTQDDLDDAEGIIVDHESRLDDIESNASTFGGLKDFVDGIKTDTIDESTAAAGVTIDGVLIKDGEVDGRDISADGTMLDDHETRIDDLETNGSGGGGLDVWHTENFEDTEASDATAGNNATFLGAGSATASPANETSTPIAGLRSIKYTQVSSSLNDFGAFPAVATELKQRNNFSGLTFYSTYDGDDDDISFVVYDVTNAAVLYDMPIKASSGRQRHEFAFLVPQTCASIRYGYHVKVENIGAILVIDDVEISTDPFVYKELSNDTDEETVTVTGSWTTNTTYSAKMHRKCHRAYFRVMVTMAGAPDATNLTVNLPSGMVIDTSKLLDANREHLGDTTFYDNDGSGAGRLIGPVLYNNTTSVRPTIMSEASADTHYNQLIEQTSPLTVASSDKIFLEFSVPIVGWEATSENVVSPMDNIFPVRYETAAAQSIGNASFEVVNFGTKSDGFLDPEGYVTNPTTAWRYTAKRKVFLHVTPFTTFSDEGDAFTGIMRVYKNGSSGPVIDYQNNKTLNTNTNEISMGRSFTIELEKDEYFDIRLRQTSSGALALKNDAEYNYISVLAIDKHAIGLFPKDRQYNLTVTGTDWTTEKAVGVPYQTDEGIWRLKFNIEGTVTSASRSSYTLAITGVTFVNGSNQSVSGDGSGLANAPRVSTGSNNGNINFSHTSTTTDAYRTSGDVELESKPTFI